MRAKPVTLAQQTTASEELACFLLAGNLFTTSGCSHSTRLLCPQPFTGGGGGGGGELRRWLRMIGRYAITECERPETFPRVDFRTAPHLFVVSLFPDFRSPPPPPPRPPRYIQPVTAELRNHASASIPRARAGLRVCCNDEGWRGVRSVSVRPPTVYCLFTGEFLLRHNGRQPCSAGRE